MEQQPSAAPLDGFVMRNCTIGRIVIPVGTHTVSAPWVVIGCVIEGATGQPIAETGAQ